MSQELMELQKRLEELGLCFKLFEKNDYTSSDQLMVLGRIEVNCDLEIPGSRKSLLIEHADSGFRIVSASGAHEPKEKLVNSIDETVHSVEKWVRQS